VIHFIDAFSRAIATLDILIDHVSGSIVHSEFYSLASFPRTTRLHLGHVEGLVVIPGFESNVHFRTYWFSRLSPLAFHQFSPTSEP
jgi:hypothetical protein